MTNLTATQILPLLGVAVLSYLFGSLNFAVIISRVYFRDDIRGHGSGSAGMTNMLRTFGKVPAALTALGDIGKGAVSALLGQLVTHWVGFTLFKGGYIGLIFALLGHLFPIFFGFKGGKGILTAVGGLVFVNPIACAILGIVYVPVAFLTRIVSIASILGALTYPFLEYRICKIRGVDPLWNTLLGVFAVVLIVYMHRENIKRLLNGTENRFEKKPKTAKK